jgi:hypothetical protein
MRKKEDPRHREHPIQKLKNDALLGFWQDEIRPIKKKETIEYLPGTTRPEPTTRLPLRPFGPVRARGTLQIPWVSIVLLPNQLDGTVVVRTKGSIT